jgi:hypothetical protein
MARIWSSLCAKRCLLPRLTPGGLGSTFTTSFTYWTDIVDPAAD